MTNDTKRGRRWDSAHPRRRQREEQMANEIQRRQKELIRKSVHTLAKKNPGKIIAIGAFRAINLETEPGHIQSLMIDPISNRRGQINLRIRITYATYGAIANVSRAIKAGQGPDGWDGDPKRAGDLTIQDALMWDASVVGHVEIIREGGPIPDDKMKRAYQYISERWVPDFTERETIEGSVRDVETDGDR